MILYLDKFLEKMKEARKKSLNLSEKRNFRILTNTLKETKNEESFLQKMD